MSEFTRIFLATPGGIAFLIWSAVMGGIVAVTLQTRRPELSNRQVIARAALPMPVLCVLLTLGALLYTGWEDSLIVVVLLYLGLIGMVSSFALGALGAALLLVRSRS